MIGVMTLSHVDNEQKNIILNMLFIVYLFVSLNGMNPIAIYKKRRTLMCIINIESSEKSHDSAYHLYVTGVMTVVYFAEALVFIQCLIIFKFLYFSNIFYPYGE